MENVVARTQGDSWTSASTITAPVNGKYSCYMGAGYRVGSSPRSEKENVDICVAANMMANQANEASWTIDDEELKKALHQFCVKRAKAHFANMVTVYGREKASTFVCFAPYKRELGI